MNSKNRILLKNYIHYNQHKKIIPIAYWFVLLFYPIVCSILYPLFFKKGVISEKCTNKINEIKEQGIETDATLNVLYHFRIEGPVNDRIYVDYFDLFLNYRNNKDSLITKHFECISCVDTEKIINNLKGKMRIKNQYHHEIYAYDTLFTTVKYVPRLYQKIYFPDFITYSECQNGLRKKSNLISSIINPFFVFIFIYLVFGNMHAIYLGYTFKLNTVVEDFIDNIY